MLQSSLLGPQALLLGLVVFGAGTSNLYSQAETSGVSESLVTGDSKRLDDRSETVPRTSAEIQKTLRNAERAMGSAETDAEKTTGIIALCRLFVEIGQHEDLPTNASLQRMSVRLRARLQGVETRTVEELRRRKIPEPDAMVAETQAFRRSRSGVGDVHMQHATASRQGTNGSASDSTYSGSGSPSSGSPSFGDPGSGNLAPGGLPDYGWTLVNLIRQTVRPDYWSTAGGPGKAIYFGHSRALVIHGSWRVQEEVADLLNALRGG